jgi:hypothetical protein
MSNWPKSLMVILRQVESWLQIFIGMVALILHSAAHKLPNFDWDGALIVCIQGTHVAKSRIYLAMFAMNALR